MANPSDADRLAIDGGQPALPGGPPPWPPPDDDVRSALEAAYADGSWGRYFGPSGSHLRELLAQRHGVAHAYLCCSGTIGVELALRGLRIGPGDEVILAAYDFPGNFRAIEAVGAKPVLIDVGSGCRAEPDRPDDAALPLHSPARQAGLTWHLDAEQLPSAISPQTKGIIVSHLHGSLADMRLVCEFASQHKLVVVEDACQAPGAIVQGKPAGSWGDCGVLSFGGSKLLTAGRGGAVLTNREDVVQRIRIFSERGNDAFPLSELQAAVLAPQLARLDAANQRRLAAARRLLAEVGHLPGLVPLQIVADEQNQPAFYKLPWLLAGNDDACDSPQFEHHRRRFLAAIQAEGVAMDAGFRGFARRSSRRCRVVGDLPHARLAASATVLLHHPVLLESGETIDRVGRALRKVGLACCLR